MVIMSVLFTAMLFLCGVLFLMYTNLKETNSTLAKLNSKLDEDVNELTTKNAILHSEIISRNEDRIIDEIHSSKLPLKILGFTVMGIAFQVI